MAVIRRNLSRRRFLAGAAATVTSVAMPSLSRAADRPLITHGLQAGTSPPTPAWSGPAPTVRRGCR